MQENNRERSLTAHFYQGFVLMIPAVGYNVSFDRFSYRKKNKDKHKKTVGNRQSPLGSQRGPKLLKKTIFTNFK